MSYLSNTLRHLWALIRMATLSLHHVPNGRAPQIVTEQARNTRSLHKRSPHPAKVFFDRFPTGASEQGIFLPLAVYQLHHKWVTGFRQRDHAALAVFRLAGIESDGAGQQVNLSHLQVEQFGFSESVGVSKTKHGAKPELAGSLLPTPCTVLH